MLKKKLFSAKKIKKTEKEIFKKYHLSLVHAYVTSRFFRTIKCVNQNNQYFMVKIRAEKSPRTKNKFLKEIYLNKYFYQRQNNKSPLIFSKYFASGVRKSPEWLIYRFADGKRAGAWYIFYDKRFDKVASFLPKIIISLIKNKLNYHRFDKVKYEEILNQYSQYLPLMRRFFSETEINQGKKILQGHQSLFNLTRPALTHGDLNPTNIILTEQGKINIIDWFDAHLNNQAYDAAFVWLILWNKPKTRKYLFNALSAKIKNKQEFSTLFKLNQIILTPKMLEVVNDVLVNYQRQKKRGQKLTPFDKKVTPLLPRAIKYFVSNFRRTIREIK